MEQIGTPSTTNASSTIITSTPTTTSNTSLSTSSSLSTTSGGVIVTNDPSSSSDDKLGLSSVLGSTTASASGIVSTPLSTLSGHKTPKRVTSSVSSPVLSPPTGKILGRNSNGTMVNTSMPSNEAELQLYRVLQKASLLAYYDTLLEMGGDDVKQLCDAGEDEFLEIMALVGMASKPLHVRRLQKALHEWMMNPAAFQTPLPNIDAPQTAFSPEPGSISQQLQQQQQQQQQRSLSSQFNVGQSCVAHSPVSSLSAPGPAFCNLTSAMGTHSTISSSSVATSISLTPTLTDSQISRIVSSAERLARTLPQLEPRIQSSKKRSARELEQVIAMNESDPRRMDEIRKYSAIYGRFDCKRKPEKPLTLHEVCVNEAAAQICKYIPALLTRRDELFPLARQVVRDSGFGHSATIRLMSQAQNNRNEESDQQAKRTRLSSTGGSGSDLGKESMDEMREKPSIFSKITKPFDLSDATKLSLVLNASQQVSQQHLRDTFMKNFCRYSNSEFDDTDSRFSFSNSDSSPQHNGNGTDRDMIDTTSDLMETRGDDLIKSLDNSPLGVQVISSSGNTIIAVANPALALSPIGEITVKREALSPDL